jgi:hypothetical protein
MSASIKSGLSETIVASSAERASAIRSRPSLVALHLATVTLPLDARETEKLAAIDLCAQLGTESVGGPFG